MANQVYQRTNHRICICMVTGTGVGWGCVARGSPGFVVSDCPAARGKQDPPQQPVRQRLCNDRGGHSETGR